MTLNIEYDVLIKRLKSILDDSCALNTLLALHSPFVLCPVRTHFPSCSFCLPSLSGIRRVGRRPDQQGQSGFQQQGPPPASQQHAGQGEGRPGERRPDRRPPRERRFDRPVEEKPEGGEFSVEK